MNKVTGRTIEAIIKGHHVMLDTDEEIRVKFFEYVPDTSFRFISVYYRRLTLLRNENQRSDKFNENTVMDFALPETAKINASEYRYNALFGGTTIRRETQRVSRVK